MIGSRKQFAATIVLISLSVIGSLLKLPTSLGSIALDSAPALVAAAILGGNIGALVAAFGHFISAFFAGFPLGAFHLLVAVEMAALVYGFAWLYQHKWKKVAFFFFFVGNAFLAPLPFALWMGKAFVLAIIPSLAIATLANIIVSSLVIPVLWKWAIMESEKMPRA
jgi:riboflavin transporter